MREGARFFSSFSLWVDKGTLRCGDNFWSDFFALYCASCEGFSTSGNAVLPHWNKKWEVAYNRLDGMNRLAAFIQLRKTRLTYVHSPSTTVVSRSLEGTPFAAREEGSGEAVLTQLGTKEFIQPQNSQYIFTRPFLAWGEGCGLETRSHVDYQKKREADSLNGEGGFKFKSLPWWVRVGRGERQLMMVSLHSTSSLPIEQPWSCSNTRNSLYSFTGN